MITKTQAVAFVQKRAWVNGVIRDVKVVQAEIQYKVAMGDAEY